jgi:hypothetical protein
MAEEILKKKCFSSKYQMMLELLSMFSLQTNNNVFTSKCFGVSTYK